jgi:GNAT superfamily N-acetyltransferase
MASPLQGITVRRIFQKKVTERECDCIVEVLKGCFRESICVSSITGNKEVARDPFHRMTLIAGLEGGEVYVAEDEQMNIVGVTIWITPGRALLDTKEQQEQGLVPMMNALDPEDADYWITSVSSYLHGFACGFHRLNDIIEQYLPEYTKYTTECFDNLGMRKQTMWKLITFAVLPEYRRRGIGKLLLDPVHVKAEQSNTPRCLEADSELNTVIYQKLGYEVKGHYVFKRNEEQSVPMWVMVSR